MSSHSCAGAGCCWHAAKRSWSTHKAVKQPRPSDSHHKTQNVSKARVVCEGNRLVRRRRAPQLNLQQDLVLQSGMRCSIGEGLGGHVSSGLIRDSSQMLHSTRQENNNAFFIYSAYQRQQTPLFTELLQQPSLGQFQLTPLASPLLPSDWQPMHIRPPCPEAISNSTTISLSHSPLHPHRLCRLRSRPCALSYLPAHFAAFTSLLTALFRLQVIFGFA